MSAYETLVKRVAETIWDNRHDSWNGQSRAVLAEVYRTLENVTPDGWQASAPRSDWLAMLRASPLAAPAEKETEG